MVLNPAGPDRHAGDIINHMLTCQTLFKNLILIFHQQDTDCFFVLILTQGSLSWWIRVLVLFRLIRKILIEK